MAFCTKCGAVYADGEHHECDPADIPQKGKLKRMGQTVFSENTAKKKDKKNGSGTD